MSLKIIDQIFGLIAIDKDFAQEILEHPLEAIDKRGFTLTSEERDALSQVHADNLTSFSRQILEYLEYHS